MKAKKLFSIFAGLTLISGLSSCALEEDLSAITSPDDFFRSYAECQQVVNGCYDPMKTIYTFRFFMVTESCDDLLYISSTTYDCRLDISPASPLYGSTMWTQGYRGVQRCNFAVQGIEGAYARGDISRDDYNQIICEAKSMRGFYYWILMCVFGNVPFYFDAVTDNEILNRIGSLPRMDNFESRDTIIDDLLSVAANAPQTRTSDNDGARSGAALAYMLVAKLAQWNEEWDVAIDALKHLEEIYGDFSQYDYEYNVLFRNKNTPESILEVQHLYEVGGVDYTSNLASMCMPCPRTNGTAIYDGVEILELGDQSTNWGSTRTNTYFTNGLQTKTGKDIRAPINQAWQYNGEDFETYGSTSSRSWMGPKFWCPNLYTTHDGNNYKVFRYADAILMLAECYCQTGDYETSCRYLNMVKTRAGLNEYSSSTQSRLLEEIQDERARELFGEFQRKFDLVRWDIWFEQTTTFSDNSYLQLGTSNSLIKRCHRYYPIPETEVIYSGGALDNDEYHAYGL